MSGRNKICATEPDPVAPSQGSLPAVMPSIRCFIECWRAHIFAGDRIDVS